MNLFKSLFHNIGVVLVGLGVAYVGTRLDTLLRVPDFRSHGATVAGCLLLSLGFFLRVCATHAFYEHKMRVISLSPQAVLITCGPYRFTRNPLYLGGNVFIFFGAASLLGSPSALVLTALHLPFVDLMIRREESQLEVTFGDQWLRYKQHVRRWL